MRGRRWRGSEGGSGGGAGGWGEGAGHHLKLAIGVSEVGGNGVHLF